MARMRTSQEVISKFEEASKWAKEAADISARASQEAISRAEEISKSAREAAEASIRAAKQASEASKKAAREAAEASVRVFEELISGAGGIGGTSQQVARQTAEAPAETSQEADSETDKAAEEGGEALARTFGEAISVAETDIKGEKREAKEVQRRIETRLESLERMYASNEDKQAEEADEEEQG